MLCMSAHRPLFHARFARAGQAWTKRRGSQTMTWHKVMEKASALALVGASSFPGLGPRDGDCC